MDSKLWIRKILTLCLAVVITASYSMVALAASDKVVGELSVSGKITQGSAPNVTVNGEAAQTGRSIFSSSIITTSADSSATINVAQVGRIQLAPNTSVAVSFDKSGLTAELMSGKVTALGATENISVKTPEGKTLNLKAGETATAGQTQTTTNDDDNDGGGAWLWYALIFGGAAAAVILAARSDNNVTVGGNSTIVSPLR